MHLIPESEHYRCMDCEQTFLHADSLTYLGTLLTSWGIVLLLLIFILNHPDLGDASVGPLALVGYVVGGLSTTLGLILIGIRM